MVSLMKFDVIIGNPPYQQNDGGHGASAKPLYHLFVQNAINLNPKYLSFIIPSRWFAGGKGLSKFRSQMLNDKRVKKLVDFSNSKDCFPNVNIAGGVCYFLWTKNYNGDCLFINKSRTEENAKQRKLDQFKPFIIRQNKSISILEKITIFNYPNLSEKISSTNPFGLPTNFKNYTNNKIDTYSIYGNKVVSYVEKKEVVKKHESLNKWKVIISKAYGVSGEYPISVLGKPIVIDKNSVCTATYLVAGFFETEKEALNFEFYLKQKFTRFLIGLVKNTQDMTKEKACFVPDLNMEETWDDNKLYKHFNLSKEEIEYIEQVIKKMD